MSSEPVPLVEMPGRIARTRRQICDAARRAFCELGLAAQIDDVIRAAGVSRGTFYNYFNSIDELFVVVATEMASSMSEQVHRRVADLDDAAARISNGIRHFCLRAHAERDWGLFLSHFGLSAERLQSAIQETVLRDIEFGIATGRFRLRPEQVPSALAVLSGATLAAVKLVVSGLETPVRAGENVTEMTLRAFGLDPDEAEKMARVPLVELER